MFQIKHYLSKIIIKVTENLKKLLQSMYKTWLMNIYSLSIIFRIRKKFLHILNFTKAVALELSDVLACSTLI